MDDKKPPQLRKIGFSFIGTIFAAFTKNWKLYLFIIGMGTIMTVYYSQKAMIKHYKKISEQQSETITILNDNNKKLKLAINDQNKKIKEANEDSLKKDESIKDLSDEIKNIEKENDKLAEMLKNKPVPKSCEEALDYFNYVRKYITWEN